MQRPLFPFVWPVSATEPPGEQTFHPSLYHGVGVGLMQFLLFSGGSYPLRDSFLNEQVLIFPAPICLWSRPLSQCQPFPQDSVMSSSEMPNAPS